MICVIAFSLHIVNNGLVMCQELWHIIRIANLWNNLVSLASELDIL